MATLTNKTVRGLHIGGKILAPGVPSSGVTPAALENVRIQRMIEKGELEVSEEEADSEAEGSGEGEEGETPRARRRRSAS